MVLRAFAVAYNNYAKRNVMLTGGLFGIFQKGATDGLVQACEIRSMAEDDPRRHWDPRRTALFAVFGFVYASGPGGLIYNKLYPKLLPGRPFLTALIDNLTNTPFLYMPLYYGLAEIIKDVAKNELFTRSASGMLSSAFTVWASNFPEDFKMSCTFWIPSQAFNFYFFPVHLRMTVMGAIGFGWIAILSAFRGRSAVED